MTSTVDNFAKWRAMTSLASTAMINNDAIVDENVHIGMLKNMGMTIDDRIA